MQSKSSLVTDIVDTIEETKEKITELQTSEVDLPLQISELDDNDGGSVYIDAEPTNMPSTMQFKEKHQFSEKEQKCLLKDVSIVKRIKIRYVVRGKQAVLNIRSTL